MGDLFTQKALACQVVAYPPGVGDDDLIVAALAGEEALSKPFRIALELRSEKLELPIASMVGKELGLEIDIGGTGKRHFHGHIGRLMQGESSPVLTAYTAELVPWLALLDWRSDSRIFQKMNAIDIVKQVAADAGFASGIEVKTQGTYPELEYCVQYRETDFAFVSRLLEEEGIAYWFRHEKNKHVMVLADAKSGHPMAVTEALEFAEREGRTGPLGDVWDRKAWITGWQAAHHVRSGKWTVKDYDFTVPATELTGEDASGNAKLARFDYPTRHAKVDRAKARSRLRMEIEEAAACQHHGKGTCISFVAGTRFKFEKHDRSSFNGEYLLTSVGHKLKQEIRQDGGGATSYENVFSVMPAGTPFRAPIATPRPMIHGVQTAVVTGPSSDEIHVDEHGRVKVQFHWDRVGTKDENSSCWVRVAQMHAGAGFGAASWPRVGEEVVVAFEEGDPDRPLITGRVYNGTNKPPYTLPDNATRSTIKTRSSKGGDESTFNEIRFEDKSGDEHLFIHAEKDRFEHTKADRHAKVVHDEYLAVDGKQHTEVKGEVLAKFGAAHEVEVAQDRKEKIGGSVHVQVGANRQAKVGANEAIQAGAQIHLKAPQIVIEADAQLTLKAGGSFITIGPDGVSISGVMVKLNSGGAPGSGSGASPQPPTAPTAPKDAPK